MPFETVVRAFQTKQSTPPIKLEVAATQDQQPIVLQIGRGGTGKTLTGSFSSSLTVYQAKAAVESKVPSKLPSAPSEVGGGGNFSGSV